MFQFLKLEMFELRVFGSRVQSESRKLKLGHFEFRTEWTLLMKVATRVFPSPTWRRPGRQARRAGPAVIRRSTVGGGAAPWGCKCKKSSDAQQPARTLLLVGADMPVSEPTMGSSRFNVFFLFILVISPLLFLLGARGLNVVLRLYTA